MGRLPLALTPRLCIFVGPRSCLAVRGPELPGVNSTRKPVSFNTTQSPFPLGVEGSGSGPNRTDATQPLPVDPGFGMLACQPTRRAP